MKSIFLTGSSGFVGKNLISRFKNKYEIFRFKRNSKININQNIVIHLAGIAHDTSKNLDSKIYYETNTEFTKKIFNEFIKSEARDFIFLSSVKAVRDSYSEILDENVKEIPKSDYGKSKLLAEKYIMSMKVPDGKRVLILRPCMIYGEGNKGNLNLLFKLVSKNIPWPLGSFNNKRSVCSIYNLIFAIEEFIINNNFSPGIYNISDNDPVSINEIIKLMFESKSKKPLIFKVPKIIIYILAMIGDYMPIPLNSERLEKLSSNYIVSNKKILTAIKKELPENTKSALIRTFKTFS